MKKSGILVITICSNNKRQGGATFQNDVSTISKILPEHASLLFKKRKAIYSLLKNGDTVRDGIEIANMQLNSRLKLGPDLGGNESSLFMPAYQRYIGRFFSEVGKNHPALLADTPHHVLILSGLYGILQPEELIQAYSCHIDDHPVISETWKEGGFLTSQVLAYVNRYRIQRVLDLTGQNSYRHLIEWSRIAKKVETLHFYSEQYSGAAALPSLGELARTKLLSISDEQILAIRPGDSIYLDDRGRISVTNTPVPPPGFPSESVVLEEESTQNEGRMENEPAHFVESGDVILSYDRDIPVTSGEHNTIFNKRIFGLSGLPLEVQQLFHSISRCPDVMAVFLGQFFRRGPNRRDFRLKLIAPQVDCGHISGWLEGPGAIGRKEHVEIRVTKGREVAAFRVMSKLLTGEPNPAVVDDHRNNEGYEKRYRVPNKIDFEIELKNLLAEARKMGYPYFDVVAGILHKMVGGYPGNNHRMPLCCDVMREAMKPGDEIISSPPKGKGASLTIRYYFNK